MMRSLFFLIFFACSEYSVGKTDPVDTGTPPVVAITDSDTSSEVEADSDPVSLGDSDGSSPADSGDSGEKPSSCQFSVWNGDWNSDGTKTMVTTAVAPEYFLLSTPSVIASAGDGVTVEFSIASQNGCGELDYNFFLFYVWSEDSMWSWMEMAATDGVQSSLEVIDPADTWDSSAYINTPEDPNLRYFWTDEELMIGGDGIIPTQVINDETVYRFVWQQTDYPPPGSNLRIELLLGGWTDPATGEEIFDYSAASAISVAVTIE